MFGYVKRISQTYWKNSGGLNGGVKLKPKNISNALDYMRGRNGGLPPPTVDDVWDELADQSGSAPEAENAPEHAPENAPAEEFPSS